MRESLCRVQWVILLLSLIIAMIEGFNLGTIFGTKFTRSRKFYPIDPDKPIADRYLYAQRYGHYGKNLIHQLSFGHHYASTDVIPNGHQRKPLPVIVPYGFPVIAPFGTEGFDLSPAKRRSRDRDEERRRDRQKKGLE